jgi:putative membrane protein
MHDRYAGTWEAGMWVMMGLGMVAVTLVAAALAVWLIRSAGAQRVADRAPSSRGGQNSTATDILDERYARGEIDEDDYLRRRAVLSERRPPP